MRISGIEVSNWGCIGSLSLADLPAGIVLLHGPNRTGKSSLVRALRSCLIDHDHNSRDSGLREFVNWHSNASPRVSVEFELPAQPVPCAGEGMVRGPTYRITKVFSTRKDGEARLEEKNARGWSLIARGKEATAKTRELLGVETSDAGLFQLLWMTQGDVKLPPKLDPVLDHAIGEVLGSLLTARDVAFEEKLNQECRTWFTEGLKDKAKTPLRTLAEELDKARAQKAAIDREIEQVDQTLNQYETARAQRPKLEQEHKAADTELTQLKEHWETVRQKQTRHQLAAQDCEHAGKEVQSAATKLREAQAKQRSLAGVLQRLRELQIENEAAVQLRAAAKAACDQAQIKLQQADAALTQHRRQQEEQDDRQRWFDLRTRLASLDQQVERARELQQRVAGLEERLAHLPTVTEAHLRDLQRNRQEANQLQARLEAGELLIAFRPEKPVKLECTSDQEPTRETKVAAGESFEIHVRQKAELRLPGVGDFTVGRRHADVSLEQAMERLAGLDKAYGEFVRSAGHDPADPHAIDQLTAGRIERESGARELEGARRELQQHAPLSKLEAECDHVRKELAAVLQRHPDWETWQPTSEEINGLKAKFSQRTNELEAERQSARQDHEAQADELSKTEARGQQLAQDCAAGNAEQQALERDVQRCCLTDLEKALADAQAQLAKTETDVATSALTDDEMQLEERHQAMEQQRESCRQRLEDIKKDLYGLQIKLSGTEGLHQKRILAEQAVNELAAAHSRELLRAQADKHLRELFDKVRNEQVGKTVGPIRDRVLGWARHVGIDDYHDMEFGQRILPTGLRLPELGSERSSIAFERESYGTIEQLGLLVRLAVGGLLAARSAAVAILDDPLAHADAAKHRRLLEVLQLTARGDASLQPPAGPLQILILTCHPDRFDHLPGATPIDLASRIRREP